MVRRPPPKGETKEDRFKRLAESRVTVALDKIRLIENLSNRSLYRYDDKSVEKIFETLQERLKEAHAKFKRRGKEKFKL
ncbi:MAG: hypothetical protein GTN76_03145 [Candidatus Aenigmarchaeota archaeon]|nr:hypothetical protein [Candidatus Aenigmarchaeota archaeon]